MKLPHELILQLISASNAVEAWLIEMEEQTKDSTSPASEAGRAIENAILDLIADDEFGDEAFCAANTDWPCFNMVRNAAEYRKEAETTGTGWDACLDDVKSVVDGEDFCDTMRTICEEGEYE